MRSGVQVTLDNVVTRDTAFAVARVPAPRPRRRAHDRGHHRSHARREAGSPPGAARRAHGAPATACCWSTVCRRRSTCRPRVAVVVLDIDRFKEVNATLGHHHGDLLLEQVARRLSIVVPDSTTVARVGSDEFAVVLPTSATRRACSRRPSVSPTRSTDRSRWKAFRSTRRCTAGIAIYPDHGDDADTLLKRAIMALIEADRAGVPACDLPARARQVQPPPAHAHRRASRRARAATSSSCSTSPTCRSGATPASASRPWCAGTIRRWRWSARTSSSSSPRCRA